MISQLCIEEKYQVLIIYYLIDASSGLIHVCVSLPGTKGQ